jgi:hypothetical protein
MSEACKFLSNCYQVHQLSVRIKFSENCPRLTSETVFGPISKLRNIRNTDFEVTFRSTMENLWVKKAWQLKQSYGSYLSRTIALPEGTTAGEYVCDSELKDGIRAIGVFELRKEAWAND